MSACSAHLFSSASCWRNEDCSGWWSSRHLSLGELAGLLRKAGTREKSPVAGSHPAGLAPGGSGAGASASGGST